jgi:alkylation response protein AidB-like acyl-CoA dehydrogenase
MSSPSASSACLTWEPEPGMAWILDEQRRMLRDSAQSFVGERLPVAHGRRLRDSADPLGYSLDAWRAFGEQGYAATLLPEAFGGLGLGVCEAGLVAEQIGHTLAPTPFLGTAVLAGWLLSKAGSADAAAGLAAAGGRGAGGAGAGGGRRPQAPPADRWPPPRCVTATAGGIAATSASWSTAMVPTR